MCICMEVHVANSSVCHTYVMWEELGHSHFLYVPAVSNVVTTGNGTGSKNVLIRNHALGLVFSIQSSVYGTTTVVKVSLFSTSTVYCKVLLHVKIEIKHRFSPQTNFLYLGLVNVSMVTETCCS